MILSIEVLSSLRSYLISNIGNFDSFWCKGHIHISMEWNDFRMPEVVLMCKCPQGMFRNYTSKVQDTQYSLHLKINDHVYRYVMVLCNTFVRYFCERRNCFYFCF
uniref:Uncharacterized protein n=1 Tax=Mus musculus TaxID=10090 RepID=Q3UY85_MOUSE|nr:unnamed protein product [Mus musculus]